MFLALLQPAARAAPFSVLLLPSMSLRTRVSEYAIVYVAKNNVYMYAWVQFSLRSSKHTIVTFMHRQRSGLV